MSPHNLATNNVLVSRRKQIVLLNIEIRSAIIIGWMEMTPGNVSQAANTPRLTQLPLRKTSPVLTPVLSLILLKNAIFNPRRNLLTLTSNNPPKQPTQRRSSIPSCSKQIYENSPENFRNTLMIPIPYKMTFTIFCQNMLPPPARHETSDRGRHQNPL
ncbi:hypothetical protein ACTXT7_017318, partial [Hymenolepis weldensis]